MENTLDCKTFKSKEHLVKWANQYRNIIDLVSIVYDSFKEEFVIFFYWKSLLEIPK